MDKRFLTVLVLAVLVHTANFWGTSVYILDEAKNAGCAMEMYQRGDVIVPTFNAELRTDKPPLHYYFMMSAYSVFGVNAFSARLFSVIAGILTVVIVYRFTRKFVDEGSAFWSSLVMVSSLQLAIQFHLAVPDPYLILLIALAFFLFYDGFQLGNGKSMLLVYPVLGLAFMSKGLVAVVIPGLVILLYLTLTGQWRSFGKLKLFPGALLFLVVAVPWYVAVGYATHGAWLEGFFLKHNYERFTSTMEGHRGFFLAPFVIVIGALFPFAVFIIQAVKLAWQRRKTNTFLLLCLIVAAVIPGFFSFSRTILPSYPAPALPFVAILLGFYLSSSFISTAKNGKLASLIVHFVIAAAVPAAIYIALSNEQVFIPMRQIAFLFVVLPMGAFMALRFFLKGKLTESLYMLSGTWILVILLFFYYCYPKVDQQNPVSKFLAGRRVDPSSVAYYKSINPAFVFAFQHPVPKLETTEDVRRFIGDSQSLFVITYKRYLPGLTDVTNLQQVFIQKDLFENPETVVLRIVR
jgi:4-amino-4-deoxy-L-arabinose transferase-like glycosyltransferase